MGGRKKLMLSIDELARVLGFSELTPIDPSSIPRQRPRGFNAVRIVRELRDQRILGLINKCG